MVDGRQLALILFFIWIAPTSGYSQEHQDSASFNNQIILTGEWEIGFTPRFSGVKFEDRPGLDGIYYYVINPRFQFGKQIYSNHYVYLIIEPFFRLTDYADLGEDLSGIMTGLQYSWKMPDWSIEKVLFKRRNKTYTLRVFPEFLFTGGLSTVTSKSDLNSFKSGQGLYPVYEYGVGLNFYLNKSFNLQTSFQMMFLPHSRLQYSEPSMAFTRLIWKL